MKPITIRKPTEHEIEARYAMPRPALTDSDWNHYHHHDLPGLDDWQLDAEMGAVLSRLWVEPDLFRREWLVERREKINAHRALRRQFRKQDVAGTVSETPDTPPQGSQHRVRVRG